MSEAVPGHIAPASDSSCGKTAPLSATRRNVLAMVVAGAAAAATAAPALPASDAQVLALFREWVALLHYQCLAHMPEPALEAEYERVGNRQTAILAQLRRLPPSHLQAVAVIWVAAWDVHGSVDPKNPALPGSDNADMRSIVRCAARLEPRLAAIAGVRA